jgi:hypothetical protein
VPRSAPDPTSTRRNDPIELDRLLPTYDFRSRYTRTIEADATTVWEAIIGLTADDLPVARLLMGLRSGGRTRLSGSLIETFPIPTLRRVDGSELVMGKIAKFWRLRRPQAPIDPGDPAAFAAFSEPGWAKAAAGLRVIAEGDATVVAFETRVKATDAAARRAFSPYWLLIRAGGSGFIRLEVLRAIARRAERAAAPRS